MRKKDKKKTTTDSSTISTLLGRDTSIEGNLTFDETIRVDGRIKGKLNSPKGTLIIGENASIEADIAVGVAIIRGKVTGRVEAQQRVEVYAPAQVIGDISAPTVTIDSGVIFNGNCQMKPIDAPAAPKIEPLNKPAAADKSTPQ